MTLLPLPEDIGLTAQLADTKVKGRRAWRLPSGSIVGAYDRNRRAIVKRIAARHIYGNRPGLGFNYEMMAIADRMRPKVKLLVAERTDLNYELEEGPDGLVHIPENRPSGVYSVPWEVARRFAAAMVDGDTRWAITDDTDWQVLIPWTAWNGQVEGPPPLPEDAPEPSPMSLF